MDKIELYVLAGMCFASGGVLGFYERSGWIWPFIFGFLLALAASETKLISLKA